MGKTLRVTRDEIVVQTGPQGSMLFYRDRESKIWRGESGNVLSVVQPGDEVMLRYRSDAGGRRVILDLYANFTHVWGRISKVQSREFEVEQNFNADPASGYRRGLRPITFDSKTIFEESAPEDLRVGRTVDIIGLKTTDSRVQATRITVYNASLRPIRMQTPAKVRAPNGNVGELK